jgi:hypothetical protein
MELVAANMVIILKMKTAAYSCRLEGCSSALRGAISRSGIVCFSTEINWDVSQLKLSDC